MKHWIITLFVTVMILSSCDLITRFEEFQDGFNDDPDTTEIVILPPRIEPADESGISDSLKNLYWYDSSRLVLRDMQADTSLFFSQITISEDSTEDYYNGLIHLFNSESSERDTVFSIYSIHTAPDVILYRFWVAVQSDAWWINNLLDGNSYSGYEAFDSLIAEYSIEIHEILDFTNFDQYLVLLKPNKIYNLHALHLLFSDLDFVLATGPDIGIPYDGYWQKDITATKTDTSIIYEFNYNKEDFEYNKWTFKVRNDGSVEFISRTYDY